jgi:hypothetical protein
MSFSPVSKADWLRQVEQDLKGKPPSSVAAEWWPGEPIDPFLDASDEPGIVSLPDEWFVRTPLLVETIAPAATASPADVNHRILQGLRHGAEVIRIHAASSSLSHAATWLDGVMTDMVSVELAISDVPANDPTKFIHALPKGTTLILQGAPLLEKDPADVAALMELLSEAGIRPRIHIHVPVESPSSPIQASIFGQLGELINRWDAMAGGGRANWSEYITVVQAGDSFYYRQVILSRAIQLVLRQLMADRTGPSPLEIDVVRNENESPENFLIRAAASATGACLAGAGALAVRLDDAGAVAAHLHRAGLHLHHLLAMESQVMKGADPLAGAYAIDHYTRTWAETLWQHVQVGH